MFINPYFPLIIDLIFCYLGKIFGFVNGEMAGKKNWFANTKLAQMYIDNKQPLASKTPQNMSDFLSMCHRRKINCDTPVNWGDHNCLFLSWTEVVIYTKFNRRCSTVDVIITRVYRCYTMVMDNTWPILIGWQLSIKIISQDTKNIVLVKSFTSHCCKSLLTV